MAKADKTGRKQSVGKKLRNQAIIAEAAAGRTQTEIGERYGINRQAVAEILSSEEAQKLVELGDTRLRLMMTKALDTLDYFMDNKAEFGLAGSAFQSAKSVLKSIGVLNETVDVRVGALKPQVVERRDGSEVILGVTKK